MNLQENILYLLNHSDIIKTAVDENKLYIAKCHFNHNTGKVELLK